MQVLPSNINYYHFLVIVYIRFVNVDDVILNKLDRSLWYFGVRVPTRTNEIVTPIERSFLAVCSYVQVWDLTNRYWSLNSNAYVLNYETHLLTS